MLLLLLLLLKATTEAPASAAATNSNKQATNLASESNKMADGLFVNESCFSNLNEIKCHAKNASARDDDGDDDDDVDAVDDGADGALKANG